MNVPLYVVHFLLKNCSADFDETLHVVLACTEEGFEIVSKRFHSQTFFSLMHQFLGVAALLASDIKS